MSALSSDDAFALAMGKMLIGMCDEVRKGERMLEEIGCAGTPTYETWIETLGGDAWTITVRRADPDGDAA